MSSASMGSACGGSAAGAPPRVTVLMSVFNAEAFLQESLDSILAQTFPDFELLVINDGSTDSTPAILRQAAVADPRVRVVDNEANIGLTRSLNRGLKLARGELIARHDGDDVACRDRLERQVRALEGDPGAVLVSGAIEIIDESGRARGRSRNVWPAEVIPWCLLFHNCLGSHSRVLFRRQAVEDAGGYDEGVRYAQEYELYSRLGRLGRLLMIEATVQRMRVHSGQISSTRAEEQEASTFRTSMRSIGELLAGFADEDGVRRLRAFWTHDRVHGGDWERTDRLLDRLRDAFVVRQAGSAGERRRLRRRIGLEVARRYLRWRQQGGSAGLSRNTALLRAARWSPAAVLGSIGRRLSGGRESDDRSPLPIRTGGRP